METAAHRSDMAEILQPLNHSDTEYAARAERAFLRKLEGGCQAPIGALAKVKEGKIYLRGNISSLDGAAVLETAQEGADPETTGRRLPQSSRTWGR